ncbi:hypothetical protein [Pseudomonas orientalis]|uniref:Uncharacterized protein n=1 Tax=Pseudomonas orientalis TaxID=76758 RepID=A0A4Q7D1U0_9PSED|nr:hypothetical protein [Pseudomonas orientalis]RZI31687.1 hypothetical protein EUX57_11665 [Pseudomonas orientalis]
MSTATEIHNKEKTLAELMVKILKEPLKPLEASIKALNADLVNTLGSITEINDTLGASADDAEKATKSLLQALRKIREEDVPSLLTKLQKHITDQSASDARAVEALFEQSTAIHTSSVSSTEAVLLEALAGATRQQGELARSIEALRPHIESSAADVSRQLSSSHSSSVTDVKAAVVGVGVRIAEQQQASQETLLAGLEALGREDQAAKVEQAEVVEKVLKEIVLNREFSKRINSALAAQVSTLGTDVAGVLTQLSTRVEAVAVENQRIVQQLSAAVTGEQTALVALLTEQNAGLAAQLSSSQRHVKRLTVITGMFFGSMLLYVGYDIWRNSL